MHRLCCWMEVDRFDSFIQMRIPNMTRRRSEKYLVHVFSLTVSLKLVVQLFFSLIIDHWKRKMRRIIENSSVQASRHVQSELCSSSWWSTFYGLRDAILLSLIWRTILKCRHQFLSTCESQYLVPTRSDGWVLVQQQYSTDDLPITNEEHISSPSIYWWFHFEFHIIATTNKWARRKQNIDFSCGMWKWMCVFSDTAQLSTAGTYYWWSCSKRRCLLF